MANWRLAESLKQLRVEINAAFPNRSKISDGAIGDVAHQKAGTSDHLPNSDNVVTAIDITSDNKAGCTGDRLAAALIASRDPRIKYVIWNRRIIASYPTGGKPAWTWRPYSGKNAHAHHLHISVAADPNLYDSKAEWNLDFDISVVQSESLTSSRDTIQNSVAVADSPKSASSLETPQDEIQEGASQQVSESASGTQVVVQPNAIPAMLPIVSSPGDTPIEATTGSFKSMVTSVIGWLTGAGAGLIALLKENQTLLIIAAVVLVVAGVLYFMRQLILDRDRLKIAADPTKYNSK